MLRPGGDELRSSERARPRQVLKPFMFGAMRRTGVLAVAERIARGIPILAYHGVTAAPDTILANLRHLHVSAARFEEHLRYLRARWNPVPLSAVLRSASRELPPRSVVITFDDGYRNLLTQALPLVRKYEVPVTAFVVCRQEERRLWMDQIEVAVLRTPKDSFSFDGRRFELATPRDRAAAAAALIARLDGFRNGRAGAVRDVCTAVQCGEASPDEDRDLMSWDEVRCLAAAGVEIGSHSDVHEPLTRRARHDVAAALDDSRRTLERELGPATYSFAYPFGAWSSEIADAVREAGYSGAVTGDPGLNRAGADHFSLRRMLVGADDDLTGLRVAVTGLRSLWQPARTWRESRA